MLNIKTKITRIAFLSLTVLFVAAFSLPLIYPSKAAAAGEPDADNGGTSAISGAIDEEVPVPNLSVTGSSDDPVGVNLFVEDGQLKMATNTGLTFIGDDTGNNLQFSGSIEDINNALATLTYKFSIRGTFEIRMTLINDGRVYNPDNGHVYIVEAADGLISATDARTAAASVSDYGKTGYLMTITSEAENEFIAQRLNYDSWIGASDQTTEGNWKWDQGPEAGQQFWSGDGETGTAVSGRYNNWSEGEPNDSSESEDCAEYFSGSHSWNDLHCTDSGLSNFIIELGDSTPIDIPNTSVAVTLSYPEGATQTLDDCEELQDLWSANPVDHRYDTILLGDDIDCDGATIYPYFSDSSEQLGWHNFRGTFNGQNHTISNFTLGGDGYNGGFGLIGQTENAVIENIELDNVTVDTPDACVGGLVGKALSTKFENISIVNSSLQTTDSDIGGIVGCAYSGQDSGEGTTQILSSTVANSQILATEIESSNAGGLAGMVYSSEDGGTTIADNTTTGIGVMAFVYAGGGVGYLESQVSGINVHDNQFNANILTTGGGASGIGYINTWNGAELALQDNELSGEVESDWGQAGGLVGYVETGEDTTTTISGNVASVDVTVVDEWSEDAGGLIGTLNGTESVITVNGNTATGDIDAYEDTGGLIGYIENYASNTVVSQNLATGEVSGEYYIGGLVGYIYNEGDYEADPMVAGQLTLSQNQAIGDVNGYWEAGGLIGELDNEYHAFTTIDQNIARGSLSTYLNEEAGGDAGGLIGYLYNYGYGGDAETHITDSYVFTDIESGRYVGGLVGYIDNYADNDVNGLVEIDNSYYSGYITSTESVGGLIGSTEDGSETTVTSVSDSFSRASIEFGETDYFGGIIGYYDTEDVGAINFSNLSYDKDFANDLPCNNLDDFEATECTGVNADGNDGNHFVNNNTVQPLKTWNFASTWGNDMDINGGYPCLQWEDESCSASTDGDGDGISSDTEANGPNDGDANNDGTPDSNQRNVTSFVSGISGKYVVVETDCSGNDEVALLSESQAHKDTAFDYPAGLADFHGQGCPGTVNISLYFYGDYKADDFILRKFNSVNNTYTTISGTKTNLTIGGQSVLKVVYSVSDGGSLDLDGVVDGNIHDPIGLASSAVNAPNTGFGGTFFEN